ncbi:MAG: hypothetical protein ACLGIS_12585 [Actinomycetes bacterium]
MTARIRVLPAALLRAGLLAAVLAIVAGIFGMHVMTANHASGHGAAAAVQPADGHSAGDAAVAHSHAGHVAGHAAVAHGDSAGAAAASLAGGSFAAPESCGSACPDAQESGASCIPLGKTGSLAAFPPPASPAAHLEPRVAVSAAVGYSYIPSGPTPCELSISRT